MKILLHIGTEKTGSTSLQTWLHANDEALRKRGVWYSASFGRANNTKISVYALEKQKVSKRLIDSHQLNAPDAHEKFRAELVESFRAEIAEAKAAGCSTYLISNEHCHSRLIEASLVQRVYDLLASVADDIEVHGVFRPQMDLFVSYASSIVSNGGRIKRDYFDARANAPYGDYLRLSENWSSVFGAERLHFWPYKRIGRSTHWLCTLLGLDHEEFFKPNYTNSAIDYRAIALANNVRLPATIDGEFNHNRYYFIRELTVEEPLSIDRDVAIDVQSRFKDANKAFCDAHARMEPEDLEIDPTRYPEKGNFSKLHRRAEYSDLLGEMITRFNGELWLERARAARYRAESLSGKPVRVRQALERARTCLKHARQAGIDKLLADIEELEEVVETLWRANEAVAAQIAAAKAAKTDPTDA